MIDSYSATVIIIAFLVTFGFIVPILDKIPVIRSFISFRWLIIVIYSAMALGAILDFSHLDNSIRFVVVLGGIILSALLVIIRSLEKMAMNHWSLPRARAKVSKGDIQASLSVLPQQEDIDPIEVDNNIERVLNSRRDL